MEQQCKLCGHTFSKYALLGCPECLKKIPTEAIQESAWVSQTAKLPVKGIFEEESLVPQHEKDSMKLEILEKLLEEVLFQEQLHQIYSKLGDKMTVKLRERHLQLKQEQEQENK